MKEADMYEPVKKWLEERGFTVYPEVECNRAGGRADIVAKSGAVVGVVEMKQSLTLDLIDQALRWRGYANYIWIAIPHKPKAYKKFVSMVLADYGIGVLTFSKYGTIWADKHARFMRRTLPHLKEALTHHHLAADVKGGQRGGGYVTPYRITMNNVQLFLKRKGGWCRISEILDYCETHYAAPRASLAKALQTFERSWCEMKKEAGKLHFRYRSQAPDTNDPAQNPIRLSDRQLRVLLALSAGQWQTPTQIARQLPGVTRDWADRSGSLFVSPILKALIKKGLLEKNPAGRGQYRVTPAGEAVRKEFDGE
ncbi:hypothetical protein ACTID9_14970 [Brevibacillus fluminis]|uniref:hypothetical protein n=1 Tax=Brevibacillus fluminis TaxID=511487 RepID=UPI003F8A116C